MRAFLFQWLPLSFLYLFAGFAQPAIISKASLETSKRHPFYLTVTEIYHNGKDKTLEISCKIFTDNLEQLFKKNFNKTINLFDQKQKVQNNGLITNYIVKNLTLTADGKPLAITYVGFELEGESAYCNFKVSQVPIPKKLDVTNSLLLDLSEQEVNVMHVIVNEHRKSDKLEYPQKQFSFSF